MGLRAYVHFHAEVPAVALLGLAHLRVAGLLGVLRGAGRLNDGRIDDRASPQRQSALRQQRPDLGKHRLGEPVLLKQMPEVQNRRLIGNRIIGQIQSRKRAHRGRIVERFFHRRVRQVEPLLHEIDAQHPLQGHHRPTPLALGVARLHQGAQPHPRHDLLHLRQELFAARGLFLVRKGQRCKRHLLHSIPPFAITCFKLSSSTRERKD